MRFWFCKIQCPFICLCKSSHSIYTSGPLKLDNNSPVPSSTVVVSVASSNSSNDDNINNHVCSDNNNSIGVKEVSVVVNERQPSKEVEHCLKSSLKKKKQGPNSKEVGGEERKKVQWLDSLGKELADVKEFESSEKEDSNHDDPSGRGCVCIIL